MIQENFIQSTLSFRLDTPLAMNGKFDEIEAIRFWLSAHSPYSRNPANPQAVYDLFISCKDRALFGAAVVLTQDNEKVRAWTNCPCAVHKDHVDGGDLGVLFQVWGYELKRLQASLQEHFQLTNFTQPSGPEIIVVTQKAK